MDVSVIIPCFNGASTLDRQLDALSRQSTDATFEVIVSDNRSTDGSAEVARRRNSGDFTVRVVDSSELAGINHARNAGIRASNASLMLFCDVDDEVDSGWINEYWSEYRAGARLVGGSVRRVFADGTTALDLEKGLNNDLRFLPWPTGANCGMAREVVDTCGLFNESFRGGGDEAEFFWRAQLAGYELTFVPQASVAYVQRREPRSLFRQQHMYGRSHAKLYSMFKKDGMRPVRRFESFRGLFSGAVRIVLSALIGPRRGNHLRQHGIRQVGQMSGRIAGSIQYRVWYI